jgi:Ca2+-transporting ATPase
MAACYGYITVFLGSSLLNILGGVPFLPLQTMWLNFTVNLFQAIGLGFGKPRDGLMQEKPRPKDQKILPPRLNAWLVVVGLVMGVGTLGVIAWASGHYGTDLIAQTMGVTTFSIFRIFSSLETADEHRSVFSGYILGNPALLKTTGLSIVTIVLATELGILQNVLGMTSLTGEQWLVCIGVALSLIVVEEAKKLLKVKTEPEPAAVTVPAAAGA